ncbi:peptidase inhibitor family I36 protein [Aeromicrobium sp. UC242_57]|uniref:peptidase inhibitor family I36 protein n=1 Tax=Aeromicrobium sp. UC242_57 TaxID=3374624 RepID=UPI003787F5ED
MKTPKTLTSISLLALTIGISLFSAGPAEALASDCPSGYMCWWSGTNYSGTMKKTAATGAYHPTGMSTIESYYNRRTKRTWLHQTADGSGSYVCLEPGARSGNLSGWQDNAKAVYLATIANC